MIGFLGLLVGFVVIIVGAIMLLINLFRKRPLKKVAALIIFGSIAVVVGIFSIVNTASDSSDPKTEEISKSSEEKTKESSTKKVEKPKETATPVTFEQMVNDYLANGVTADEKYDGKLLQFSGTVTKITAATFGGSEVHIEAGNFTDNEFMNTTAVVKVSDDDAKKLVTGQVYTFEAKGSGAFILTDYVSTLDFKDGKVK
jgi:energy-coupling factor transporter transmembrane protein EcfT